MNFKTWNDEHFLQDEIEESKPYFQSVRIPQYLKIFSKQKEVNKESVFAVFNALTTKHHPLNPVQKLLPLMTYEASICTGCVGEDFLQGFKNHFQEKSWTPYKEAIQNIEKESNKPAESLETKKETRKKRTGSAEQKTKSKKRRDTRSKNPFIL